MRILGRVGAWVADRLGLEKLIDLARHPVPEGTTSPRKGWMYVLGIATAVALLLQVATGIALATRYIPAPSHAYQSLEFITDELWLGGFLRGMHFYGASAMVILITLHMTRVFLTGSYKFPRELTWMSGVALLVLTIAMAFTGQLLRWDANGVWGVFVASHYAARVPIIGAELKQFILAGETVGGATLSRFYALHVILMPLLIFGIIGLHLYLVFHHGVSEPPRAGRPVDPTTYRGWYRAHLARSGRPYFPDAMWREAVFGFLVVAAVIVLSGVFGPKGPGEPADPTLIPTEPKPDWFLLWYYGLLSIKPPRIETFMMVYLPLIVITLLILLPLASNRGERSPLRRPGAVLIVVLVATALGVLTELGSRAPWVMDFEAQALPASEIGVAFGPAWDGAQLFNERGCQHCHAVAGSGGAYGPPLTNVMRRLPPEIVTTRIVQGFGNMPGYRDMLTPGELEAILVFLHTLEER